MGAIGGSPYRTVISKVPCPVIGAPAPCNGKGECLDSGVCSCLQGWTGEYCQTDLAYWLRIGIVIENAVLGCLIIMFMFSVVWQKCVRDKEMFERLQHEDIEED